MGWMSRQMDEWLFYVQDKAIKSGNKKERRKSYEDKENKQWLHCRKWQL